MRLLIFLFILYTCSIGSSDFKETRYIDAIGINQYKYGNMNLENNILTLTYIRPKQETISYKEDKLTIEHNTETKTYTFKEYPDLEYMGIFLKAIINNNYNSLGNLFLIKKKNNTVMLDAKPVINNIIEYIEIKKDKFKLKEINIYMTNKDNITIEIIN